MAYRLKPQKSAIFHKVEQGGANLVTRKQGRDGAHSLYPYLRRNGCSTCPLKVAQRWSKVAQQRGLCSTLRVGALIGPNPWREVEHVPSPFAGVEQ
jgi:hypothetical protein